MNHVQVFICLPISWHQRNSSSGWWQSRPIVWAHLPCIPRTLSIFCGHAQEGNRKKKNPSFYISISIPLYCWLCDVDHRFPFLWITSNMDSSAAVWEKNITIIPWNDAVHWRLLSVKRCRWHSKASYSRYCRFWGKDYFSMYASPVNFSSKKPRFFKIKSDWFIN